MVSKKLFFLFSVLLCMVGTKALAYDIAVKNADGVNILYNYINDETELEVAPLTKDFYSGSNDYYSGSVVIPEEVIYEARTLKVTRIGERAFYQCGSLISVTIPNSVTCLGWMAFSNCSSLTSVTIPNSVTSIEGRAFWNSI